MLQKKHGILAFTISLIIHCIIFGFVILTFDKVKLHAAKKTIIKLKTVKLIKQKPKIKRIVKRKRTEHKKIIKPKPKPKPRPKPKPIKKHKTVRKPKIKHKTIYKPLPKIFKKQPPPKPIKTEKIDRTPELVTQKRIQNIKAKYLKLDFSKILQAIEDAKFYPKKARMLDIEGDVKVEFILEKNGNVRIIKAETNKRFLKKAAIEIVKKASSEFPKPPENVDISVTIKFRLAE